MASYSQF